MTLDTLKERLGELGYEESVVFEQPDYADAVIGVSEQGRVVYDYGKMVSHLVENDGMDEEEAMEFIDYNTIRALPYAGDLAPIVVYPL